MNAVQPCELARDTGYFNTCNICGTPADAAYFDVSGFEDAPVDGQEIVLATHELHPQYCGSLLYFAQYAERKSDSKQVLGETPGYLWMILCNSTPRPPYLPTTLILNPWGYTAFPVHLRLQEGCVLQFVVRKTPGATSVSLSRVGARLMGRSWYNATYGGAPARL